MPPDGPVPRYEGSGGGWQVALFAAVFGLLMLAAWKGWL